MRAGTLAAEGFRSAASAGLLAFARTQPTEVGAGLLLRDSTSATSSSDALSATVILAHAVYMVRPRRRRASHALSAMRLASSQLRSSWSHILLGTGADRSAPQPTQVYFGYHTVPAFAAKLRTVCTDIAKSARNRRREADDRADSSELLELGRMQRAQAANNAQPLDRQHGMRWMANFAVAYELNGKAAWHVVTPLTETTFCIW